jgi:membrane-bound acyltransferase YfiQ involved in biofilm formation
LYGLQEGATFVWTGSHLWYLIILFTYSLIFLPLFLAFETEKNRERLSKVVKWFEKTGLIFLLVIPAIFFIGLDLVMSNLGGELSKIWRFLFPVIGGWSILMYIPYFVFGYLFTSHDKQFKTMMDKNRLPALILAIIALILGVFLSFDLRASTPDNFILLGLGILTASALLITYGWGMIILIFSLGRKYLSFNHKSLKFLNEIILPFYIVHQVVLVTVAYFIIQLQLGVFIKLILLITISFVIILGLALIIRQANILRFIFGMKLKKKKMEIAPTNTTTD